MSFSRNNAGDNRDSFSNYYVPNVKINDCNVLIDGKRFFDLPVKNEEEAYEIIIDMSNNNGYTTGKLIVIDLSKQTKLKDLQQVNFIGKLENQNHGATMFFIIEKNEKKLLLIFEKILLQSYK